MKLKTIGAATGLTLLFAGVAAAAQAQTIDTTAIANDSFCSIGPAGANSIGQTFTAPAGATTVSSFGLEVEIPSSMIVRGEMWAWNTATQRATGAALYTSGPASTANATQQTLNFTPGAPVPVTPGQTYVVFLTTVRDAGAGSGCVTADFGAGNNSYPGGELRYQFSNAPADFTANSWSSNNGVEDAGFRVTFAAPATVPTLSEWAMILFGVMLAGGAAVLVQRRRLNA